MPVGMMEVRSLQPRGLELEMNPQVGVWKRGHMEMLHNKIWECKANKVIAGKKDQYSPNRSWEIINKMSSLLSTVSIAASISHMIAIVLKNFNRCSQAHLSVLKYWRSIM
jgi:hypothetical protein